MWIAESFAVCSGRAFVTPVSIMDVTRENAVFVAVVTGAVTESERPLNNVIPGLFGSPNWARND